MDALFHKHSYADFKWFDPKVIVVDQWVRMKCIFGCSEYGQTACCPSYTPSVSEFLQFFREYSTGVTFHFEKTGVKPGNPHAWSKKVNQALLKLQREVFIAGY